MIDEKRFPLEEITEEKKREFTLFKMRKNVGAYCVNKNGRNHDNLGYIACHAYIRQVNPLSLKDFIGVFSMKSEGAEELWNYITSLDGPFRDLFLFAPDGWSLLSSDNEIFGFRMPDKIFQFKPYPLLYAFLICTRMPQDFHTQTKAFKYLLSKDIDKHKAFIMSPFFEHSDSGLKFKSSGSWNGSHQCLSETGNKLIDFNMWSEGKYFTKDITDGTVTSKLWQITSKNKLQLRKFCFSAYGETGKSRFGARVTSITDDNLKKMSEDFDKYLELRYK